VRTYVTPWDGVVLREALLREHYRGGQSFFVVPRVADLPDMEEWLRAQVPEVKFITAHGQMSAGQIEERMSAFYDRKYDVLLSTTIVESGLDIPTANTLIVYRSDRFGLAQLYQLRGRVGRAKMRAYAYLTMPADRSITEAAQKRLQVLADLDSLGALPEETAKLMKIVEVKLSLKQAMVAKLDIGPKGAVVTFADGGFPDLHGLLGYIERLKGSAKLRPDSKMTITRDWPSPDAR